MNKSEPSIKQKWVDYIVPNEPHKWERRLNWDQLSESEFRESLSISPKSPVDWQTCLEQCCQILRSSEEHQLFDVDANDAQRSFVDLWQPFQLNQELWLHERFGQDPMIDPLVFKKLANSLIQRLCYITSQVLWSKFNEGRNPGDLLLAHISKLDPSKPEKRDYYKKFIRTHQLSIYVYILYVTIEGT